MASAKTTKKVQQWEAYTVMHGNQKVVTIHRDGTSKIYSHKMMPYNLYLEPALEEDMETRIQNLENFYYWFLAYEGWRSGACGK